MKSVDTNLLVRLVIQDDPAQLQAALKVISAGVLVPLTVMLEFGWVLKSRYGHSRARVAQACLELLEHPGITVADHDIVGVAISLIEEGSDFADIVHLIAARGSEAFVTFDRGVPDGSAFGVPVEYI